MYMEGQLKVHLGDLTVLIFLSRQDVGNEMVPIKEPVASEDGVVLFVYKMCESKNQFV
jgi:hypothetical protein